MKGKSLGTITEIIESVDMAVSYAHDDFIFLEQPEYLLQLTKNKEVVLVHVNEEISEETLKITLPVLQERAKEYTMHFVRGSYFRISRTDGEHFHVELLTIH